MSCNPLSALTCEELEHLRGVAEDSLRCANRATHIFSINAVTEMRLVANGKVTLLIVYVHMDNYDDTNADLWVYDGEAICDETTLV